METAGTVHVSGLREFTRAMRKLQTELPGEVRSGLLRLAGPVATKAQDIAAAKGLLGGAKDPHRGELIGLIKPFATQRGAGIRESAVAPPSSGKRGGRTAGSPYPYPRRYEFGGRGEGEGIGPRAFMYPAAEESADGVRDGLDQLLGELTHEQGF